jgi:hypothetical protein
LSVRNRHEKYSLAFFRLMLAISHTRGSSRLLACDIVVRCARSIEFENALAAPRQKIALQSEPIAAWVSAMTPASPRVPRHHLPNSRALAHRMRVVAAHCF